MSTLGTETFVVAMEPSVEPPGMSERLAYTCTGAPASRQTAVNSAQETPSVV